MSLNRRGVFVCFALVAFTLLGSSRARAGGYLTGIDISHWQGTINWTSVRNAGHTFAFCKATEGTNYTDPTFATNWPQMKAVGLIRGAYHYGRPGQDARTQARFFVNTVRPREGDLQLVLDLESTDGQTPAQVWAWTQKFCEEVRFKSGRPPIIYTGFYFWRDSVGNPTNNLGSPLWMPRWGTASPLPLPAAWSNWSFWQWSSTGSTPGISGNVDQDYFNGTVDDLKKLTFPRTVDLRHQNP